MESFLLTVCAITSLLPIYCLLKNSTSKGGEKAILFWLLLLYSIALAYGVIARVPENISADSLAMVQLIKMVNQAGVSEALFNKLTLGATALLCCMNVGIAVITWRCGRPLSWCPVAIMGVLVIASIVASLLKGGSIFTYLFMECCGIMAYFAWVLGLTYKEFCVLGNIYLQASICMLAAVLPLIFLMRHGNIAKRWVIALVLFINTISHGILYVIVCQHYYMPL